MTERDQIMMRALGDVVAARLSNARSGGSRIEFTTPVVHNNTVRLTRPEPPPLVRRPPRL